MQKSYSSQVNSIKHIQYSTGCYGDWYGKHLTETQVKYKGESQVIVSFFFLKLDSSCVHVQVYGIAHFTHKIILDSKDIHMYM